MGLRDRMLDINIEDRLSYDPVTNTVFMNYPACEHEVKKKIKTIRGRGPPLELLGQAREPIVNYEGFIADDDAMHAYMDAVNYVERKY
jgi:hypothetical protein